MLSISEILAGLAEFTVLYCTSIYHDPSSYVRSNDSFFLSSVVLERRLCGQIRLICSCLPFLFCAHHLYFSKILLHPDSFPITSFDHLCSLTENLPTPVILAEHQNKVESVKRSRSLQFIDLVWNIGSRILFPIPLTVFSAYAVRTFLIDKLT